MARTKKAAKQPTKKPHKKRYSHAAKLRALDKAYNQTLKDEQKCEPMPGPFAACHLTVDPAKLAQQQDDDQARMSKLVNEPAVRVFKVKKGEPFPTELEALVHEAAQKVAQEIIQKRDEQKTCNLASVSPREAYEHCNRYLGMLSMEGQNAVLGRLLEDTERARQDELDAHMHREQQLAVRTRSLQKQVFTIQNIKAGGYSVLNF